ncbi:MAG: glutamine-hydrolyzing GMP synthase [Deltaproteobacteria bacterium]|nr:glutamine-hydrolyzing GMP synthase [Deltaproteobacteria bacterium]
MERAFIAVLDFGGQYAHLIAKRIRHLGVYTRVFSPQSPLSDFTGACGIVLSGGPGDVFAQEGRGAPPFNSAILDLNIPILGLCYGHQLIAYRGGSTVADLGRGEFGLTRLRLEGDGGRMFAGVPPESQVWMSHGNTVTAPPEGFRVTATTTLCPVAAMEHRHKPIFTLQFHPEVTDTAYGTQVLDNFAAITGAPREWTMAQFLEEAVAHTVAHVAGRKVLLFLSGGVDSTVAFALLSRALGEDRVMGLFIDNGFMRLREGEDIMARYQRLGFKNVRGFQAEKQFLVAVAGLTDPQAKRHAVGETFIRVRDEFLAELSLNPEEWMLGQGTLYPDIIESGGSAHAQVIKSHHNRVQGIQDLIAAGQVVEPLKDLYKDEVRRLGEEMGLPKELVWRHPFPGPGLSINVLCAQGDETFPENEEALPHLNMLLEGSPYQGVLLPVRSVGVQGDNRTYTPPAVLTGPADWVALEQTATHITNDIRRVNRVVYLLAPQALPPLVPRKVFCTKDRLDLLRQADHMATKALQDNGLMGEIFQLLVILLPLGQPGGNGGECVVLRPVVSEDVMTARFARLPWPLVHRLAGEIMTLPGVQAVFYDVSHKPPATFGWE